MRLLSTQAIGLIICIFSSWTLASPPEELMEGLYVEKDVNTDGYSAVKIKRTIQAGDYEEAIESLQLHIDYALDVRGCDQEKAYDEAQFVKKPENFDGYAAVGIKRDIQAGHYEKAVESLQNIIAARSELLGYDAEWAYDEAQKEYEKYLETIYK